MPWPIERPETYKRSIIYLAKDRLRMNHSGIYLERSIIVKMLMSDRSSLSVSMPQELDFSFPVA